VVDQLAAWVMAERAQELPPIGGFARLAREGLYARELQFQHAVTETAPGHAALYTGRVPRENGIYSNEILRSGDTEPVSILRDRASRPIAVDGVPLEGEGSSLAALHSDVATVADLWRAIHPEAGTNHGSPGRFDRSVPLYLRAPGRVPAGVSVDEPLRFDAFTRTLASLLGLPRAALAPAGRDLCQPL
jgi:hypothetical protein